MQTGALLGGKWFAIVDLDLCVAIAAEQATLATALRERDEARETIADLRRQLAARPPTRLPKKVSDAMWSALEKAPCNLQAEWAAMLAVAEREAGIDA